MGGRGGSEQGGGMTGSHFRSVVTGQAAAEGFVLNDLQQMILDAAIENEIITRSESEAIVIDGGMLVDDLFGVLEEELNENLRGQRSRWIRSKTHTAVLKSAISFWKRHHGGKIPDAAKVKFNLPFYKETFFGPPRNFTTDEWMNLTSGLGAFGVWLNRAFAAAIAGLPMPADF